MQFRASLSSHLEKREPYNFKVSASVSTGINLSLFFSLQFIRILLLYHIVKSHFSSVMFAFIKLSDVPLPEVVKSHVVKGDTWAIHKFGGTCVGTAQRIQNVADIVVADNSERKLVVVSAMSKVTDMMYDLIERAQSRDDSYELALDAVFEKHKSTAVDLLDGDELASFLSTLSLDVGNLKAMLRAIYIGFYLLSCIPPCMQYINRLIFLRVLNNYYFLCFSAGHATESFSAFVVGHGELWSAQILSYVLRKVITFDVEYLNGLQMQSLSTCVDNNSFFVFYFVLFLAGWDKL